MPPPSTEWFSPIKWWVQSNDRTLTAVAFDTALISGDGDRRHGGGGHGHGHAGEARHRHFDRLAIAVTAPPQGPRFQHQVFDDDDRKRAAQPS